MNQILNVEDINQNQPKNNKNKKEKKEKKPKQKKVRQNTALNGAVAGVVKILRFFAISLIVFGVFNIGTGSYAIYKNRRDKLPDRPVIQAIQITEDEIQLTVQSENIINDVYYKWSTDDGETKISGNGATVVNRTLKMPQGTNELTVRTRTTTGQTEEYSQVFTRENGDITIGLEPARSNKVIVNITGKNEIAYMTYRWNEEEAQTVQINDMESQQEISVRQGKNTLTIEVGDINGKVEKIQKQVEGKVSEGDDDPSNLLRGRPRIQVTTDGSENFIVIVSYIDGLDRLEIIANGTDQFTVPLEGQTDVEYKYPLIEGENTIEATAYNLNGQSSTFKARLNKK